MPRAEGRSAQIAGSLARAERRARDAHQRGLRAGSAWRPAAAARHVRSGLRALAWTEQQERPNAAGVPQEHRALAARLLMSLAHYEAEQGRTGYGLRLLDHAEPLTAAADRGVLLSQHGLLLMRAWRGDEALRLLDEAVTLLQGYPDPSYLARTLLNRSFCHLNVGSVRRARPDLIWCQRISADHGLDLMAAKATHNLGYCALLEGDLPGALRLFSAAAAGYRRTAPSTLPVLAMDKARALLAAGLAHDAARELDTAIVSFRRQRLDQDHAEAELARSLAALAADDLTAARRWAAAAARRFRRRDNQACACLAELTWLRARALSPGSPRLIAAQALLLAGRLRDCGLTQDADMADLIAGRALIAAGRNGEAQERIKMVRRRGPSVSLDASLLRRLARAELAEAEGRPGAALAELRAGLAIVHTRRGRLGSLDLQTGTAALGADLAATGLRLALDRGSAQLVFAWLERSRAQAFRVRPVRPPADPQAAAALAELRQLIYLIRNAELTGHRDQASTARRAELQRQLRERSWEAAGLGGETAPSSLNDVSAALSEAGQVMISIMARNGRVLAVVLRGGSVRLVGLGDFKAATEAARRLAADLDTLAGLRLPSRLAAVISESVRHQAEVLTAELVAPLRPALGDDGVVLAATGTLASIPWSLLPDLRGRPVTVCPSASSWLAAWRQSRAAPPRNALPVLVAGPNLRHAASEITEIAKVYPGCRPLLAETATVDATLRALDGAPLAHLAAHGYHDRENVLFSRLELADGPLMAYDIQGLSAAPRQVVLSACDVGQAVVRPGQEILGFSAALLYVGTTTVISSVTRVADNTAVGTMNAYHRALSAGARPAEALAEATAAEPFSPFVCFGSG
ncbi:MAG TPA: CHAT domain-containing protein [Streptosporangiaceae bacterium]